LIGIREQIQKAARQAGIKHCQIHAHDCHCDRLINAGTTSRGTEIVFSALADQADVFLVLSDIKPLRRQKTADRRQMFWPLTSDLWPLMALPARDMRLPDD
jgi:hypothetical protein